MTSTALKYLGAANSYLKSLGSTTYNMASSDDFTIEWWQKFTTNAPNPYIFDLKDITNNNKFSFYFTYTFTGSPAASPDISLNLAINGNVNVIAENYLTNIKNKWLHFAVCRSSNVLRVFMNGNQIGSDISDSTAITIKQPPPFIGQGNSIFIGVNTDLYNQHAFGGLMYNFIWIKGNALYTTNFTPSNNKSSSSPPTGTLFFLSNMTDITTYNFTNPNYYVQNDTVTLSELATTQSPTITFSSIPNKTYGTDTTFSLSSYITSNSSGSYTYSSSDTNIATIDNNGLVTILNAAPNGITITINQAANGNYSAGSATSTLTINKGTPTITFNLPSLTYGDSPINLTTYITSNSNGTLSFSSSDSNVASINANTLTINASGNFTITASQTATGNYSTTTTTSATINVNTPSPTITFNLPSLTYGDSPINLTTYITSNSNGTLSFSSSDSNVASINGNTLTINASGNFTITATQTASGNYSSRTTTSGTINVNSILPTITFNLPSLTYGDSPINLTTYITSNSNGTLSFSSSDSNVASINGNTLTINASGNFTITATQTASGNYSTRTTTSATINVNTPSPTTTFNLPSSLIFGSLSLDLSTLVSTNSNASITYSSSNNNIVEINGNMLILKSVGNVVITLNQSSSSTYSSFNTTKNFQVVQATFSNPLNIVNGNHLVYAVDVLNIPFINLDTYSNKLIRNNILNTNKLFTNNNNVKLFSVNLKNIIMY